MSTSILITKDDDDDDDDEVTSPHEDLEDALEEAAKDEDELEMGE